MVQKKKHEGILMSQKSVIIPSLIMMYNQRRSKANLCGLSSTEQAKSEEDQLEPN